MYACGLYASYAGNMPAKWGFLSPLKFLPFCGIVVCKALMYFSRLTLLPSVGSAPFIQASPERRIGHAPHQSILNPYLRITLSPSAKTNTDPLTDSWCFPPGICFALKMPYLIKLETL